MIAKKRNRPFLLSNTTICYSSSPSPLSVHSSFAILYASSFYSRFLLLILFFPLLILLLYIPPLSFTYAPLISFIPLAYFLIHCYPSISLYFFTSHPLPIFFLLCSSTIIHLHSTFSLLLSYSFIFLSSAIL